MEGEVRNMKRRVLAWVTAAAMLFTSVPGSALTAYAQETEEDLILEAQEQEVPGIEEEQVTDSVSDEELALVPEQAEGELSGEDTAEDIIVSEDDNPGEGAAGVLEEDAFTPIDEDGVEAAISTEDGIPDTSDVSEEEVLVAAESDGTVSSIDLKINGSDDTGTILFPKYFGNWSEFELEIHYEDGSSTIASSWNEQWEQEDDDTGYYYLASSLDNEWFCIRFAHNGELLSSIPGSGWEPVWLEEDYDVYAYASEDQMKNNDPSDQVTVRFARGPLYEMDEDITLDSYGHARIHFPAQTEPEMFRYGLKGTQGSVFAALYEQQDDGSYTMSTSEIESSSVGFTGNANTDYVLDIQCGDTGWSGRGFIDPLRTISSIAVSQGDLSIPAYRLWDDIYNLSVTVTYEDNSEEVLKNWTPNNTGDYSIKNTLNGDLVYFIVEDEDGNPCYVPNVSEGGIYNLSETYTIVAATGQNWDEDRGEYYYDKSSSATWTVYPDAAPEDAMELDTEYAISKAAPEGSYAQEWRSFTATEEDTYKVTASGSWQGVYIYRKNEDGVWESDDSLYIGRDNENARSRKITLAADEKILIAVTGPYSYWEEAEYTPLNMSLKVEKVVRTITPIDEGSWYTAQIEDAGDEAWFSFTPEEDGFYSVYISGAEYFKAALYDASQEEIASNNSFWGEEDETVFTKELQEGVTYLLCTGFTSEDYTGSFKVKIKKEADRNPVPLELDTPTNAVIAEEGGRAYFSFVPEETGTYLFSSDAPDGEDTYGYIYDENWDELGDNDDDAGNRQFLIAEELEEGRTYYFGARYYDSDQTGSFPVILRKKETPTSVSIEVPEELTVLDYWTVLENSVLTLTYEGGDIERLSSWNQRSEYQDVDTYIYTLNCTSLKGSQFVLTAKYKGTDQYLPLWIDEEETMTVRLREGVITLSLADKEDKSKVWQTKEITLTSPSGVQSLAPETEDAFRIAKGESKIYKLTQDAATGQEVKLSFYNSEDIVAFVFDRAADEYVLTQTYYGDSGTWSRSLDGNAEASDRYLAINSRGYAVNGIVSYIIDEPVPEEQYTVTDVSLKGNMAKTSVLDGLRVKNVDGGTTPHYVDLSGLSVEISYEKQDAETCSVNKFNSWGYYEDPHAGDLYLRVYEHGKDPKTTGKWHELNERLSAGTYDLVAVSDHWSEDDEEISVYSDPISFTVVSLQEAASSQVLTGNSITLDGVGDYYDVFSWTSDKDGTQGFSADKPLTFRQIQDAESGEELAILSDGGNDFYSTEFAAGKEYLFVLGADKAVTSVTVSKKTVEGQISKEGVTLTEKVDHSEPLLAGIDGVRKQEFGVEYTYENGQTMTLEGDEQDAYNNQFRYEVREKDSDEVMMSDADNNPLGIGTYLVQAIHRTLSAIRSHNTVDLTVTLPQMETLDEIRIGESMDIEPMQRYLLRFTAPKEDQYWLGTTSDGYVNGSFYEINEEGDRLIMASQPLSEGKDYLVVVERSSVGKTITVQSRTSQSEVPDDVTPTQLTLNKSVTCSLEAEGEAWYTFSASKDGNYHFEITGGSITTMLQDNYCFGGYLNGKGMFFTGAYDAMYGNLSMKAGDKAALRLRSWGKPESGISVLVTEGKTPIALEVQARNGDDLTKQKWQYIFQGNMLRLFESKIIYQDGTSYTSPAGSMEDPYGNRVDCEGDIRKNGNQLRVYANCFVRGGEETEDGEVEKLETVEEVLATASFSLDPSELAQLTIDNPLSITPDPDVYYQPFAFTAPSEGTYVVSAGNSSLQRAVWNSWDGENGYYDSNHTDGIIKLSEGETVLLAVVTDTSEPIEISASLKKDPTALSLSKAAKGRFAQLEDVSRSGMQATVTYSDGTTEIIKAGDDTDPYGNVVKTTEVKLANGKTRITMTCGIYSVSSDTENLTVDEVQRVTTADSVIEVNHKGRTLVALDVAKDGTYRIYSPQQLIETNLAAVYDDDLNMTFTQDGTVQLTAGKLTLMSFVVASSAQDTISVKLIRTDYDPCEAGHTPGPDWIVKEAATCTKDGLQVKLCTVCENVAEQEVIPKLGHDWNEGTVTTAATCS